MIEHLIVQLWMKLNHDALSYDLGACYNADIANQAEHDLIFE